MDRVGSTATPRIYKEGEVVYVQEHSWPGVNNPEGFCVVLKSYTDEQDDLMYDLKYIIDKCSKRGIYSKFISENIEHGWNKH
jgi:acetyl-CoA carboxylase alpha subunit